MSAPSLPWVIPGFDHIGNGQSAAYIIGAGSFDSVAGGNVTITTAEGIRRLRCGPQSGNPSARMTIPSATEIVFGFLSRWNSGGIATPHIGFYSGGTREISLEVSAAGALSLRRGTTAIASDNTFDYQDNVSRYIELAYKVHNSAGAYEVRVNGTTVMSGSTDTTITGNPIDQFRMQGGDTFTSGEWVEATYLYFKEWEDAETPGFYGTLACHLRNPNSDVAVEFTPTPGAGDNFEEVDETPLDDDTTYVEATAVGDVDEYGMAAPPAGVQAVLAVVRGTVSRVASGSANIEHGLKNGASEAYGDPLALTSAYGTYLTPFFTQPDGSDWTLAGVSAARSLDRSA